MGVKTYFKKTKHTCIGNETEFWLHEKAPTHEDMVRMWKFGERQNGAINNKQTDEMGFTVVWPCEINHGK